MLDAFASAGGNLIDTADVYSGGESESIIGRWLTARPDVSDRMVVATKARFSVSNDVNDSGASRRHLRRAVDASRRRLQRDTIDLYQIHAWDPSTPADESLRVLDDFVRSGAIDYSGFSNMTGWQLQKMMASVASVGTSAPITIQPQYSLLVRETEYEILPSALDAQLGVLAWGPLGGGWLTGKYSRTAPPTGRTRLGENPSRGFEAYSKRAPRDGTWKVLEEVERVARDHDVTSAAVALAWLRDQTGVTSVILGARSATQLESNMTAAGLTLSIDELTRLSSASDPRPDDYPYGPRGQEQRA
ncbi:aryl-alcohol dehydrogenase (NADP+) [Microbacterium sp. AK009]|nr:aryl-alcohol dehydrogenase (NADP+) [Microbacterium sp. AK009]